MNYQLFQTFKLLRNDEFGGEDRAKRLFKLKITCSTTRINYHLY